MFAESPCEPIPFYSFPEWVGKKKTLCFACREYGLPYKVATVQERECAYPSNATHSRTAINMAQVASVWPFSGQGGAGGGVGGLLPYEHTP